MHRRPFLLTLAALAGAAAAACAGVAPAGALPPIVFVHGNGDSAALWLTTLWRFESNGWPRERVHAIHLPYPLARDSDNRAQPGRTSSTEHREFLAGEIAKVLASTGAQQVVLMANSRGGNAVRSYVADAKLGGAARVSHAILGGTPNHGVRVDATAGTGNEFNGAGPFLIALNNQGAPGVEITPGPRWLTVRSADNDKFAQPEGTWLGAPRKPTGVTFAGPELRGAKNVVLPAIDHRETSFSPTAFAAAFEFITGRAPATTGFVPEARVVLDGQVSGQGIDNDPASGSFANNLPLNGATVEVYATDAATGERTGGPRWRKTTGADGRWGPFPADGDTAYEFVISAPVPVAQAANSASPGSTAYAITHIYRQPFVRSSSIVHLRVERLLQADRDAGSVLVLSRPRGYFGLPRDRIVFDGQDPAPGIPRGVAGVAQSKIKLSAAAPRTVLAAFNGQRMAARSWPAAENRLVLIELH
ncbi:MAG: twin-arginine translocation pathway signal [Rubrivivax sp.]|nr:twin-arginine translocation pathway signal [Rubrivivax sp.]